MTHEKNDKTVSEPVFTTITSSHDGLYGLNKFTNIRLPTDKVLRLRGNGNYEIYKDVLSDDQVMSTTQQRRLAVISKPWQVKAGGTKRIDKSAAEHLKEVLSHIAYDSTTEKMLYGVFFGYAVAECIWARDGGFITLDAIKVREQFRFEFDYENSLYWRNPDTNKTELMPERKFWHYNTGMYHDDEPYGLGLAHYLYWPVFFKKHGMKFWLKFLEKFAHPTVIGKYQPGASKEDQAKLLSAARSVGVDTSAVIPDGMMLEFMEAARSGVSDYNTLRDKMDAAISKVVLSQTMTTDDGSSKSQAEVHSDVRDEVVKSDSDLISESFNCCVAKWLTEWNFPGAKIPQLYRELEDPDDLDKLVTRDKTLFDMGYKLTPEKVVERYGEGYLPVEIEEQDTADENQTNNTLDLAEFGEAPNQLTLDLALNNLDNKKLQAQAEKLLEPLLKFAQKNPNKLEAKLAELYKEMDVSDFGSALAQIMFLAETFGRATGEQP